MNRTLLTITLSSLISLGAYADLTPGTDILSVGSLAEEGIELTETPATEAISYTSPTTGTPYSITNVAEKDGDLYFNMGLGFRNTESAGYLKEIRLENLGGIGFTVYAGNEPISTSPFSQAGVKTLEVDREAGTVKIDGPYTYLGVWTYEATVGSVEIVWSEEAPVVAAAKPFIVLNSELGCPSGTTVTIDSDTQTAEIEVVVSCNGDEVSHETLANPATVTLEGEVGDRLTVEARAVAEGYAPSDWMKRSYTITDPMLAQPEFSLSEYSSVATLGAEVTLANPNAEGSLMIYSVCGGEEVSTSESSVTVIVAGEVGDEWTLTAYCTAEGWVESETTEWRGTIATNVCPTPIFNPAPGEYPSGTQIKITAQYPAASVSYRINGGEWVTSTSLWNLSVELTEDLTIEAYSSASSPYVDSETVTAEYTVEKLGEDCDEIRCSTFGDVAEADFNAYTSAKTSNGAVYAMYGRGMADGMFVNGEGYVRTEESSKEISRIKVDARFGNTLVVYVSESPIVARDASLPTITVPQENFGQWLEMPSDVRPMYFYLTAEEQTLANCIDRIVVDYNVVSGVDSVAFGDADAEWYDMTGRRVANPTAGIYVRKANGRVEKVLVK